MRRASVCRRGVCSYPTCEVRRWCGDVPDSVAVAVALRAARLTTCNRVVPPEMERELKFYNAEVPCLVSTCRDARRPIPVPAPVLVLARALTPPFARILASPLRVSACADACCCIRIACVRATATSAGPR